MPGCGCPSVGQDVVVEEAYWSRRGEEGEAWRIRVEVVVAKRKRMGVEVETFDSRMGVEVGVFDLKKGEEVGAFEKMVEGVAVTFEETDEVEEGCEKKLVEGEEEVLVKNLVVEGEAREKKSGEVAVVKGMTTTEEVGAEGKRSRGEVGEEAPCLLQCHHWLKRNTGGPFLQGVSGNLGSD